MTMRHYDKRRGHEVTVRCGMEEEYWVTRRAAIDFYLQGAMECDGSEAGRYMSIAQQLMDGCEIATDGMEPAGGWKDDTEEYGYVFYEDENENGDEYVYEKEFPTLKEAIANAIEMLPEFWEKHFKVGDEVEVTGVAPDGKRWDGLVAQSTEGYFVMFTNGGTYQLSNDGDIVKKLPKDW